MVLDLLRSPNKPASVPDLIARKKYGEALAILQEQLKKAPGDTPLRMQTADVLVLQGRIPEATGILEALANEFAAEGFAAKAIAVLKKIQKVDPRRKDLESRVVDLFTASAPARTYSGASQPTPSNDEIAVDVGAAAGQEEALDIGFEPEPAEPVPPAPPFFLAPEEQTNISDDKAIDVDVLSAAADDAMTPVRVRSPLFGDFDDDELLDVIRGLELLTFEPGDIVVTEGEKGDSLYVLTSGTAKAFVRNKDGGSSQVRQLNEGDFFGEISVLTGKPRTATITAAATCELLRLDRHTLDSITASHPHVREVLQQFYEERTNNDAEIGIRGGLDVAASKTCKEAGLANGRPATQPGTETIVITEADLEEDGAAATPLHLRKLAIQHSRKQNWTDAVQAWQQYIALRPDDTDAANALGVLFGKLGRWKEAAQTFERLVEVNAKDATVFFNLGVSYRQLDLLPQAARAWRQAVAIKPDYDKARQNLSAVVSRIKKGAGN